MVANAGIQPLSGKLTDIFSRRTGIIWANIFFGAGTLICGLAKKQSIIILGRVVAGLGGGCLTTISTFIASDLVPLRRRALWGGYANIWYGLGVGLGGVFGGWMNDTIGWRWAFLIQVPIIAVSGTAVAFLVNVPVKETDRSRLKRIDFLGSILLVTSLVLLLLGLNSGGNIVPWSHPLVIFSIPLSVVSMLLFIYVEDKVAAEPIIPIRLLLHPTVISACVASCLGMMAYYSLLYYGPIFFQIKGQSSTQAGVKLIPVSVGTAVGALGAGIIIRTTGVYLFVNYAIEAMYILSGALVVAFLNFDVHSVWPAIFAFFLVGFGSNGMLTVTQLALISAVGHEFQAVITSASYAFRSIGSTIGITVSSAVFQNVLKAKLLEYLQEEEGAVEIISRVRNSIAEIRLLSPDIEAKVLVAYMDALQAVWYTALGMIILCGWASLFMREHVLHNNLARRDEDFADV